MKTPVKRFHDIIYSKKCIKSFPTSFDMKRLIIISDFDFTITKKFCPDHGDLSYTTFSLLEESPKISDKYRNRMKELDEIYCEVEKSNDLNDETLKKSIKALVKEYRDALLEEKLTDTCLANIVKEAEKKIRFRKGFDKFLSFLLKNEVPLYIITAGLKDSVEVMIDKFYKQQIDDLKKKNLYNCIGNSLVFTDGVHSAYSEDKVYVYNKGEVMKDKIHQDHSSRNQYVLIGDNIWDTTALKYLEGEKYTIGFGNFNGTNIFNNNYNNFINAFDVTIVNDGTFDSILELISGNRNI